MPPSRGSLGARPQGSAYTVDLERVASVTVARVLEAVFGAARKPATTFDAQAFGAVVSIRIDPDDDGVAVLEKSWEFDCFYEVDRFPCDVLAMTPDLENTDLWKYLPPRKDSDIADVRWVCCVTAGMDAPS